MTKFVCVHFNISAELIPANNVEYDFHNQTVVRKIEATPDEKEMSDAENMLWLTEIKEYISTAGHLVTNCWTHLSKVFRRNGFQRSTDALADNVRN